MASSTSLTERQIHSTLSPAAAAGVDQLWKFQLRKEHAALLEKLQANEKLIQSIATESKSKTEAAQDRINALEAKLVKLEGEEIEEMQRRERQRTELDALREQMREFKREHAVDDAPLQHEITPGAAADISIGMKDLGTTAHSTSVSPNEHLLTDTATGGGQAPIEVPTPAKAISRSTHEHNSIRNTQPNTTHRPITRSHRTSLLIPASAPQPAYSPLTLTQGHASLATYVQTASTLFSTLHNDADSDSDSQLEIDFVARFVKGIKDTEVRERLKKELLWRYPSRTKADGKIEILCQWEHVEVAMRRLGMVEGGGEDGGERRAVRRG